MRLLELWIPFIALHYSFSSPLDRYDIGEEDYGRYCVTCVAARLEEEPNSQGNTQNHQGQQESFLETFDNLPGFQVCGQHHEIPMQQLRRPHIHLPTYSTCYRLRMILHIRPERETQAALSPIPRTRPILGEQTFFSLNEFDPRLLSNIPRHNCYDFRPNRKSHEGKHQLETQALRCVRRLLSIITPSNNAISWSENPRCAYVLKKKKKKKKRKIGRKK